MKWVGIHVRKYLMPWTAATLFALVGTRLVAAESINVRVGTANRQTDLPPASLLTPPAAVDVLNLTAAGPFDGVIRSDLLMTPESMASFRLEQSNSQKQEVIAAPEPTSLSLLAVGLGIIAVAKRRKHWLR
jgi:hypothetical protein